jgi:hypothetical protein
MNQLEMKPFQNPSYGVVIRKVLIALLALLVLIILIGAGQLLFYFQLFGWIQLKIRTITGTDIVISNGITALLMALIFTLPFWGFLRSFLPFPQKNKKLYRASVFICFAAICFATYYFSQDVFFDTTTGTPLKYYSIHPNGEYKFYSSEGFDPLTGDTLKRITKETVIAYLNADGKVNRKASIQMSELTNREASLSFFEGSIINNSEGTIFIYISQRQESFDLSKELIVRRNETIQTSLLEGTHYFVVTNADGHLLYFSEIKNLSTERIPFQYNDPGVMLGGISRKNDLYEQPFYKVLINSVNNWSITIDKASLVFRQME